MICLHSEHRQHNSLTKLFKCLVRINVFLLIYIVSANNRKINLPKHLREKSKIYYLMCDEGSEKIREVKLLIRDFRSLIKLKTFTALIVRSLSLGGKAEISFHLKVRHLT